MFIFLKQVCHLYFFFLPNRLLTSENNPHATPPAQRCTICYHLAWIYFGLLSTSLWCCLLLCDERRSGSCLCLVCPCPCGCSFLSPRCWSLIVQWVARRIQTATFVLVCSTLWVNSATHSHVLHAYGDSKLRFQFLRCTVPGTCRGECATVKINLLMPSTSSARVVDPNKSHYRCVDKISLSVRLS